MSATTARRQLAILAAALSIVIPVAVGGPANAATPASPSQKSCSLAVDTGELVCVPYGEDLNAAVLKQTGLVVVTPGSASTRSSIVAPSITAATVVVSQLFESKNYTGPMFQITGSSGCDVSTITYSISNLATYGFDNQVDSFKSFSGCTTKIWEFTSFGGAGYGYYVNATTVYALGDKASSVKVT